MIEAIPSGARADLQQGNEESVRTNQGCLQVVYLLVRQLFVFPGN